MLVRGINLKKKYNMKKTISMRMFISEFDEAFTSHMKLRLLEIGKRCVLTRKEIDYCFDLKHVEHTKHDLDETNGDLMIKPKEYTYGQLLVNEGVPYFSDEHTDGEEIIQYPTISNIYNEMDGQVEFFDEDIRAKRLQDSNIDYLVDNLLEIYPPLSPEYMKIISKYKK